jgi:copper/silver efflux system protein
MITAVIRGAVLRWRVVVALAVCATTAALAALPYLSLDALPDLADTQVVVSAEWPGRGADLVDQQITTPIATALRSLRGVRYARGMSMTGDAFIYVVFEDPIPPANARSRVAEQLAGIRERLPEGVVPSLGPDASSVGWIYEYALVDSSGRRDLGDLRTLQDWNLRYRLQSVPGVAEVAAVGGHVPRYEVELDPSRLVAYHLPLSVVADAVRKSNRDLSAGVLESSGQEQIVTSRGQVGSIADLAAIPIRSESSGAIVTLGDLGTVRIGAEPRRGMCELGGRGEVVGGIVIMRQRENALRVVHAVKRRIAEIQRSLPPGVGLVPVYDRSELIVRSLATLRRDLAIEMLVVSLVIVLFLGSVRSALIPILSLPLASLFALVPLAFGSTPVNIMSLGGIAISVGAMVDGAIIMIENVHKELEHRADRAGSQRQEVVSQALQTVGRPVFLALLVIVASFLPLLGLQGTEGRMFRPLVLTKTYTMLCAALLAITMTPALASRLVPVHVRSEFGWGIARFFAAVYARVVRYSLARPLPVLSLAGLALVSTIPAALSLGHEFMPALDEGSLLFMPSGPPGLGGRLAVQTLRMQDSLLARVAGVAAVFGKAGRARTATDPAPLAMIETIVTLEPEKQFARGRARERLLEELDRVARTPGFAGPWWMPIQTRNEMLATGVRSPVGIKVFGPTAAGIESLSALVANVVRGAPGVRGAYAERLSRSPAVDFEILRERAALAGFSVDDVQQALTAMIAGEPVGHVYRGRARLDVALRLVPRSGGGASDLLVVPLVSPAGSIVELGQIAALRWRDTPAMLQQEGGDLFGLVTIDVGGRPPADVAAGARRLLETTVSVPGGYYLEWTGQYHDYARARSRMLRLGLVALLVIVALLYWNLGSARDVAIVLLAVPFSLIGAFWLLWLLHYQLSVAVWVGLLALAGLDAETGTIMLLYIRLAVAERRGNGRLTTPADLDYAIIEGASKRLRPKLMTVAAILLGLLPILVDQGPGSEALKRIAAPMAGGILVSFLMELLAYPCLYRLLHRRRLLLTTS